MQSKVAIGLVLTAVLPLIAAVNEFVGVARALYDPNGLAIAPRAFLVFGGSLSDPLVVLATAALVEMLFRLTRAVEGRSSARGGAET